MGLFRFNEFVYLLIGSGLFVWAAATIRHHGPLLLSIGETVRGVSFRA